MMHWTDEAILDARVAFPRQPAGFPDPAALRWLRLVLPGASLIAACSMSTAMQDDWEMHCAKLATVAEYAAEQRDSGASLPAVLAEIDALTDEARVERKDYANAARLAFGTDSNLDPGRLAQLVYQGCMTSIRT